MFNEKNLFVFGKGNMVNVYAYPFKKCHLQMKIGPLNAPVVKILEYNELTFICTKKSLYIFKKQCMLVCIDEITFMTITDACMCDGVLFISAMDGFLVSVRFTIPKALITD
ncbi:hypothetical protein PAEPH01_1892 [Pancytospora epiphaga]|nr:hypothetical protein PAEPH01_1892 [Pancytospora epiphaga]